MIQGTAIEVSHHDNHQIITAKRPGSQSYFWLYAGLFPEVNFGDIILLNDITGEAYLRRGNSKLTFKIHVKEFPIDILPTLILNRMLI